MMRARIRVFTAALALAVAAFTVHAAQEEKDRQGLTQEEADQGFVSMFNGVDLQGWDGKPDGWRIEDGAITGESTEENPCLKHHYLFWEHAQPGDFILRFKYRIIGGNSGVQIRSKKLAEYDAWGYQADIEDGQEWTGCLFQHDRGAVALRGTRALIAADGARTEERIADPAKLLALINTHGWNDYEVEARGSVVRLRINGELFCEADDRDAKLSCKSGYIALQMHPGPPMKAQFKDLRIKILE